MKPNYRLWTPLAICVALAAGLWIGYAIANRPIANDGRDKLNLVLDRIAREYVDEISMDSLVEMTLPRLLQNLDPHSAYIPLSEVLEANRDLESTFFGIGIQFHTLTDTVYVIEVVAGGPSEAAGLLPGDRIIEVDGKNVTGPDITDQEIIKMLRGDEGTKVNVTVRRPSSRKPLNFEITRGLIPSVSIDAAHMVNDSVGYVRVTRFARNTYAEFIQALNRLRHLGAESYIIDLRGNSGGYLEPSVMMVNEFMHGGEMIVTTHGRNPDDDMLLRADGTGMFADARVVVLIDEFTASSSEIFSGAIQDNDRGMVIGRRSFGKGLVQHPIVLPDSSELRLTVQRYYTPSGRCIQKLYKPGQTYDYETEIIQRYNHGEVFSADSIVFDPDNCFTTVRGRTVYGGGGIIPDVFVPSDTSGVTPYYLSLVNANLLVRYCYEYTDLNRPELSEIKDVDELLRALPSDYMLLTSFLNYASQHGVPTRPYYVNISRDLIVNQLKALIARDVLGTDAYYQIIGRNDRVINEAIRQIADGNVEQITMFNDPI